MKIGGEHYRAIWQSQDGGVRIIDQTQLPHRFETVRLESVEEARRAIAEMWVRGAPLIGATAAFGVALAMRSDPSDASMAEACQLLGQARPTAVDLHFALERMRLGLGPLPESERAETAFEMARALSDEIVEACRAIGGHGLTLIREAAARKSGGRPIEILTHCNAGWLAAVDHGTALAPIYAAHDAGLDVHVWVDETRPRNQGASLTAFELGEHGVPHTLIADNVGGHLAQHGRIDLCIVGSDRVTRSGDCCNKIGTYLKALAAYDNDVPFYVAIPFSTIDWTIQDGVKEIPIEERDAREVLWVQGADPDGRVGTVRIAPDRTPAANFGFDVTPARLVSAIITERGVCEASETGLGGLYP